MDGQNYTHNSECHPDQFDCSSCPESNCIFFRYGPSHEVAFYQVFNVIYGIWVLFSLVAFGQLVLAGVFSSWYFVLDKKRNMPACLLIRALKQTCRYHLGTAIFGALILTLLTLIRMGLDYLERKLKSYNQDNALVKAILACMKCFFWCLEKFIRYLNRNAYIMTAIQGTNFCRGAREAFVLLLENVLRVAVLTRITNLIILISKLVIMGTSLGISYLMLSHQFQWMNEIVGHVNYIFVPLLLIGFGSFVVASLFLEVYEMGVDTILLSFLIDSKHNDGSKARPYFMSKSMLKLLKRVNEDLTEVSSGEPDAPETAGDDVVSDLKPRNQDTKAARKRAKKSRKKKARSNS
ncbi:choline transporter-like protein 2 isoform X2 [Tigriopus californicus]|nr:choline transporter-like protein 2 isoform X2 [Tigriopus californicus]